MNMVDVKRKASVTIIYKYIEYVKRGRRTHYIDPRTKLVNEGIATVKPFAFNPDLYWIVCPHCQKIHEYPILRVRKKEMLVYGNCKGRVTKGLDQSPILIDESEVIEYGYECYQAYHFGVQRCKDTRSSSVEWVVFKRIEMEERMKKLTDEIDALNSFKNILEGVIQ